MRKKLKVSICYWMKWAVTQGGGSYTEAGGSALWALRSTNFEDQPYSLEVSG